MVKKERKRGFYNFGFSQVQLSVQIYTTAGLQVYKFVKVFEVSVSLWLA